MKVDDDLEAQLDVLRTAAGEAISQGQRALEALRLYRASDLPVPEWALDEIESCYENFCTGAQTAGWKQFELLSVAPRSLGQAFGIEDVRAQHGRSRRRKALLLPFLRSLVVDQGVTRSEACKRLGITSKEGELWLPAQRKNARGHRPYATKRSVQASASHLQPLISGAAKNSKK